MATYYIDPTASKRNSNGSLTRPYNSWSQVSFKAGNTYLQKAGTTATATLSIGTQGTPTAPVKIGAYGTGAQPVINGAVSLSGAKYISVTGLEVHNTGSAAILLHNGANHNSIIGNSLSQSLVGIWIGSGAGADNLIQQNKVTGNSVLGIAVDKIANPAGHATRILNNTVTGSGTHGIDINGSNFVVDGNTTSNNGLTTPGSSGIHVFGGFEGAPDGYGVGNTITNNVAVGNHDVAGPDGNGIQLDQYSHGNVVSKNFAYNNDGGGIVLYDSYSNQISGNLLYGNARDPGNTHSIDGDLVLAASIGITEQNIVSGNVGLATSTASAVFIDPVSAADGNKFTGNVWQNTAGFPATEIGLDTAWSSWVAFNLLVAPLLPQDKNTGVPLSFAPYSGQLSYSFLAGQTETIDGTDYTLIGWAPDNFVVMADAGGGGVV